MAAGEDRLHGRELRAQLEGARTRDERLRVLRALVGETPDDAEARYQYARELSRSGRDNAEAIAQFRRVLALDPKHAEARLGLGVIYHRQGDVEAADTMYNAAVELNPRLVRAWLNLGALTARRRDFRAARRAYARAAKLRPKEVTARQGLGRALHELGKLGEARAEWDEARALDPQNPATLRGLAKVLGALRDEGAGRIYEEALAANPDSVSLRLEYADILQATGEATRAEEVLSEGVRVRPKVLRLWQALAGLLRDQGRPEDQIAVLRDALVQTAGDERLRMALAQALCEAERLEEAARELRPLILADPRNADARRLIAAIHACEGQHEKAAQAASTALRIQPAVPWPRLLLMDVPSRPEAPLSVPRGDDVNVLPTHRAYALAVRGLMQLALGRIRPAADFLGQAVRAAPETAMPRVGRALAYLATDSLEPSYEELRTAAILEPQNPHVQHLFGEVAFHTGRFDEASRAFNAALQDESVADHLRALTFFCRARAHRKRGLAREAIESYLQAERLDPEYAPSFFGCGVALQEAQRIEEALRHYERCVALSPQHARGLLGLATCLAAVGRAPEAVEAYRRAIAADPTYALPRYNLAVLLERTGDPQEVALLLRGYLRREPKGPHAEDAHRRLRIAELRASGALATAEPLPAEREDALFTDSSQDDAAIEVDGGRTPIGPRMGA